MLSVVCISNFSLLGGFGSGFHLTRGRGHKWDGSRLSCTSCLSPGCLELGGARPFDKRHGFHSSPLTTSLLLPMGTTATPLSPSAPSEMLCYSHSSMATLNQSRRVSIPLGAGWEWWQGEGDLPLMKDGGTPQLHHRISTPRTHGFQCQMAQLTLNDFLLTSKKLFSNKSPFIAMPVSSHAEVLKHLGLGRCLLNLTGPSAIAFQ